MSSQPQKQLRERNWSSGKSEGTLPLPLQIRVLRRNKQVRDLIRRVKDKTSRPHNTARDAKKGSKLRKVTETTPSPLYRGNGTVSAQEISMVDRKGYLRAFCVLEVTEIGTWNIRSIIGKEGEIVEEMEAQNLDYMELIEIKRKGQGIEEKKDGTSTGCTGLESIKKTEEQRE
ncbi:hypothetical protein Trydic_g15021 [Trypoxylus dichotomus]